MSASGSPKATPLLFGGALAAWAVLPLDFQAVQARFEAGELVMHWKG